MIETIVKRVRETKVRQQEREGGKDCRLSVGQIEWERLKPNKWDRVGRTVI